MGALLLLGEPDTRQRAHAGVHPVHVRTLAEDRAGLLAPLSHRAAQAGHDQDAAAPGDLGDQPGAKVCGRVQSLRRRGGGQLLAALLRKMWPMAVG
jgi:hypothetical protein